MSFIREKEINGRKYLYLVENKRIGDTVRQKVLRYIGPKSTTPNQQLEKIKNKDKS